MISNVVLDTYPRYPTSWKEVKIELIPCISIAMLEITQLTCLRLQYFAYPYRHPNALPMLIVLSVLLRSSWQPHFEKFANHLVMQSLQKLMTVNRCELLPRLHHEVINQLRMCKIDQTE